MLRVQLPKLCFFLRCSGSVQRSEPRHEVFRREPQVCGAVPKGALEGKQHLAAPVQREPLERDGRAGHVAA